MLLIINGIIKGFYTLKRKNDLEQKDDSLNRKMIKIFFNLKSKTLNLFTRGHFKTIPHYRK